MIDEIVRSDHVADLVEGDAPGNGPHPLGPTKEHLVATRYEIVRAISLAVGGAVVLLQHLVTPLSGNLTGEELVAKVTEHRTAMGWAPALDLAVLSTAPAFPFVGHLAHAGTSVRASIATAFLYFPFVLSTPAVFGLGGLALLAGAEPNKVAMVHLIDNWKSSAWFALSLIPYVVRQIVGAILMAIALLKAKTVPSWLAVATGAWPLLAVAGQASGVRVTRMAPFR